MPILDGELLERIAGVELEPVTSRYSTGEEKAFAKIQRLCSVRERCAAEIKDRLVRDGFSAQEAEHALERAHACGLVDDQRYAEVLIRSRIAQGKGREGIRCELERSGIDVAGVPGWPEEFFDDDASSEVERALALLRRKPPRAKDVRSAAFRRLVSKGYSYQLAYDAARRYAREAEERNRSAFGE